MAPTDVGRGMDIDVKTIPHYMATLVLGLTFVTTIAVTGCAVRYYDADHRDYHRWDGDEDRAYPFIWATRTRANLTANMEGWMAVSNALTGTGATAALKRAKAGIVMTAIATIATATIETGASYSK